MTAWTGWLEPPVAVPYGHGEVAWLLSMSREEAVEITATIRSTLAGASESVTGMHGGGDSGDRPPPVIARWVDVQEARRSLRIAADTLAMSQLRMQGQSEQQIADQFGVSHMSVSRRVRVAIRDLVTELNRATVPPPERLSRVDVCMGCATEPRVRLAEVRARTPGVWVQNGKRRRYVPGPWRVVKPAKQASVCVLCLAPSLMFRVGIPVVLLDRHREDGQIAA